MAFLAIVDTGFVALMAGRAGKVAVMLAVRILFVGIFGFGARGDFVIKAVALHAGLVLLRVFRKLSLGSTRAVTHRTGDAALNMSVAEKLLRRCSIDADA